METTPDTTVEERDQKPRMRRSYRVALIVAGVVTFLYAAIGWYVSSEIMGGLRVDQWVTEDDLGVIELGDQTITLEVADSETRDADRDAVMGLRWQGGYGQVGPAIAVDGPIEHRSFRLLEGTLPPIGQSVAHFDVFAFPSDPSALGIAFETVTYPAPLGDLEAWLVPGNGSTWIIAVHGLGADRTEMLRLLDTVEDLGYPVLTIRYRNDEGAPVANDLRIMAGQEEWEDVAAAVDYALANGASDVVIVAASMGGALTLNYAMNSDQEIIRGIVLEAPVTDMREIISLRSGEALPIGGPIGDSMLATGRAITWLRTGLDFDTVDYVDRADELTTPILLFHGNADPIIPYEVGADLAEARPDLVEFHTVDDAAHVRAWNEGPERYEATLEAFLQRIGRSP